MTKFFNKKLYFLIAFSILSFLFSLHLSYIGEEGVYTITTLEMLDNISLMPSFMGGEYPRPPMVNWLMVPIVKALGAKNVLLSSRILAALSTVLTAVFLLITIDNVYKNRNFSLFTVACYLSGDLLFKRGWVAYSDPVFSFFTVTSLLILINFHAGKYKKLIYAAPIFAFFGFLTKAYTAYVFYFVMLSIFMVQNENFRTKKILFSNLLSILMPIIWYKYLVPVNHSSDMIVDMSNKFESLSFTKLIIDPIMLILRFLPISFLAVWAAYRKKVTDTFFYMILVMVILNYLPYLVSPENKTRYILPLYPFISFIFAYLIWNYQKNINLAINCLFVTLVLKYAWLAWLPYHQNNHYGKTEQIAKSVLEVTKTKTLYVNDDRAGGIGVISALDAFSYPKIFVRPPCPYKEKNSCVLNFEENTIYGKVVSQYKVSGDNLYLHCS